MYTQPFQGNQIKALSPVLVSSIQFSLSLVYKDKPAISNYSTGYIDQLVYNMMQLKFRIKGCE